MHAQPTNIRPPSKLLLALEGCRASLEYAATLATLPILHSAQRGDGHSVLIFPGLTADDVSTLALREFLRAQGYKPHKWGVGLNLGPREGVLDVCLDRVKRLRRESDRKVSLIGWSLGGIYAREIGKLAPEDVRCVITLGTPFKGSPRATNAWRVYELASGEQVDSIGISDLPRRHRFRRHRFSAAQTVSSRGGAVSSAKPRRPRTSRSKQAILGLA